MLDETIDLIIKYSSLKTYFIQIDKNNKIINEGIRVLESKIQIAFEKDRLRLEQIEKDKKKIELKKGVKIK